jgi:hypothetical protein
MNYCIFEVGNKSYKLRLNTRNTIELEKRLGCNPLGVFGDGSTLPTVSQMVTILWASLQQYNHSITINDAYEIFDNYLEDGHIMTDFFNVIIEVYKVSGLMPNEVEAEKN